MDSADFQTQFNVSRETIERLETYVELLERWNPKINIVAKSTISDVWARHIVDSAQVSFIPKQRVDHWVDLGSGGGFPGLVVAILKAESESAKVTLVESDNRKSAFLRAVARETGVNVSVISERIEKTEPLNADILSARALAPLPMLLGFCERHLQRDGIAVFSKGSNFRQELEDAQKQWMFSVVETPSLTDKSSVILKIGDIQRV